MPGWSGVVDAGAILGLRSPDELVEGATVVGTSSCLHFRAQKKANKMKVYVVFDGDYHDGREIIKAFTSREKAIDLAIKEVHEKTDGMYSDKYVRKEINNALDDGLKDVFVYTREFNMDYDDFIGIEIIEVEE